MDRVDEAMLGHFYLLRRKAGCCTATSGRGLGWEGGRDSISEATEGPLSLGKHRKLKDVPSGLHPFNKCSALCPLDARKKILIIGLKCFICEVLALCNAYSKADTHLKVVFNTALL